MKPELRPNFKAIVTGLILFGSLNMISLCQERLQPADPARKEKPVREGQPLGYWIAKLKSDRKDEREAALNALWRFGQSGGPAVPALIKALKDNEREIRHGAAYALSHIGPAAKDAVPALIEAIYFHKTRLDLA